MHTSGGIPEGKELAMSLASAICSDPGLPNNSRVTPIVFVVDDDIPVRESVEMLVRSEGWWPEALGSAQQLLACPRAKVPSCLILDVPSPGMNGLELQKRLARERSEMPIIFVTSYGDVPTTVQAMKAGAVEFLTKPFRKDALLGAIRESLERSRLALHREIEISDLRNCYVSLSRRERQVMVRVVAGLLNKQAGLELGISEITVKAHRGQVMRKMKANSLPDLVRMAARLGLERSVTMPCSLRAAA
jgi:FixJ family two-component response regulator